MSSFWIYLCPYRFIYLLSIPQLSTSYPCLYRVFYNHFPIDPLYPFLYRLLYIHFFIDSSISISLSTLYIHFSIDSSISISLSTPLYPFLYRPLYIHFSINSSISISLSTPLYPFLHLLSFSINLSTLLATPTLYSLYLDTLHLPSELDCARRRNQRFPSCSQLISIVLHEEESELQTKINISIRYIISFHQRENENERDYNYDLAELYSTCWIAGINHHNAARKYSIADLLIISLRKDVTLWPCQMSISPFFSIIIPLISPSLPRSMTMY